MGEATKKQKRNRKEESIKLKITLPGVLLWIAKLLCIMLFGIAFLLVAKLILGYTKTITMSTEENVIDIGLAIVGIAVAVWAGLNIANSIERKELEELRSRTEGVKQLVDNLDNIESIAYDTFLQALLRTGNDEATAYFYKEFSKREANSSINYYTLTKIEDLFGQVHDLHNTVNHLDTELMQKAEDALEYIDGLTVKDRLVKAYLTYRKAEFKYYCGYVASSAENKYDYFSTAIDLYQEVFPKMGITLPQYNKCKEVPAMPDNADRKLAIYMANSLGDASSKIIQFSKEILNTTTLQNGKITPENLKEYGEMAIFYCGCAAKWSGEYNSNVILSKDLHYFEVYYRNYGVAYERYDNALNEPFSHAGIIISNYYNAFCHLINGTKVSSQRVRSVYHVLLSYLKRYFDNELKFEGNNGPLSPFAGPEALAAASTYNYKISDEQLTYLKEMVGISDFAMTDMPRNNLPAVMNGFAYAYVVLLKAAGNTTVCNAFKEDCSTYLAKISAAIHKLDVMNIGDDYATELKKRHDMLAKLLDNLPEKV